MRMVKSPKEAIDSIVSAIEQKLEGHEGPLLVAIDGRSGTGKSTLAKEVAERVNGVVILGDDFYSGGSFEDWDKRSPKEKADLCIDWKRIRTEALEPLLSGKSASWHPFNWQTGKGLAEHFIKAQAACVIILDVVYSNRPELSDIVDLSVLVQLSDTVRRKRLKRRERGSFMVKWHQVWDEAEDYYFSQIRPPSTFDLVVETEEAGNT